MKSIWILFSFLLLAESKSLDCFMRISESLVPCSWVQSKEFDDFDRSKRDLEQQETGPGEMTDEETTTIIVLEPREIYETTTMLPLEPREAAEEMTTLFYSLEYEDETEVQSETTTADPYNSADVA